MKGKKSEGSVLCKEGKGNLGSGGWCARRGRVGQGVVVGKGDGFEGGEIEKSRGDKMKKINNRHTYVILT